MAKTERTSADFTHQEYRRTLAKSSESQRRMERGRERSLCEDDRQKSAVKHRDKRGNEVEDRGIFYDPKCQDEPK